MIHELSLMIQRRDVMLPHVCTIQLLRLRRKHEADSELCGESLMYDCSTKIVIFLFFRHLVYALLRLQTYFPVS